MKITKNLLGPGALVLGVTLVASAASAAEVTYPCTGAADQTGLAAAITSAGAGGTVWIDDSASDCILTTILSVGLPVKITSSNHATVARPVGGSAFGILASGSGATIENLNIVAPAGNGVFNHAPAGFWHQADGVVLRNNTITAARCVQQASQSFGPATDVNRATGGMGAITDSWIIDRNTCITTGSVGLFLEGNDNVVTNNEIVARGPAVNTAILIQNRYPVSGALAALPGAGGNFVRHNVLTVHKTGAPLAPGSIFPLTVSDFPHVPDVLLARAQDNIIDSNCIDATNDLVGSRVLGLNDQYANGNTWTRNNVNMALEPAGPVSVSNRGLQTADARGTIALQNDFAGAGDLVLSAFFPTNEGNLFDGNKAGRTDDRVIQPQFITYDESAGAGNVYVGTKFCTGVFAVPVLPSPIVLVNNRDGHYCSQGEGGLSPSHDCSQGLGYAGSKAMPVGEIVDALETASFSPELMSLVEPIFDAVPDTIRTSPVRDTVRRTR